MCCDNKSNESLSPFAITPSNTASLVDANGRLTATKGISIAGAGTLAVETVDGDSVTIPSGALVAGHIHRMKVRKVLATGTSATGIIGYN